MDKQIIVYEPKHGQEIFVKRSVQKMHRPKKRNW